MSNRTLRTATLALLTSTILVSPAFAQEAAPVDATPQTPTTQSPAPGTNATDVTSNPNVQAAQEGHGSDAAKCPGTAPGVRPPW